MRLNETQVLFNKDIHEYRTPEGTVLSGVTSMLSEMIFQDKYSGVPQSVLDKAAARGTEIHEEISRFIVNGDMPVTEEGKAYAALNIPAVASEYLVSDMMNVATFIDIVGDAGEGGVILYDVKTNRTGADRMYLQWQLSVNAYLFSKCNPDIPVSGIEGIWLCDDKAERIPLQLISSDIVSSLIEAHSLGLPFCNPFDNMLTENNTAVMQLLNAERKIAELEKAKKAFDEVRGKALATIKELLQVQMDNGGGKSYEGDEIKLTLVPDSEKKESAFDLESFRNDNPDIYEKYLVSKTTKRKGYVKITLR